MQNSAFSFPVRKKLLIGLAAVLQHAAIAHSPTGLSSRSAMICLK